MNLGEAKDRYGRAIERVIVSRRLVLASDVETRRREYERFIVPPRPRGVFWWMFIGDYERCCFERQRLSECYEAARVALCKFDLAITRRDKELMKGIQRNAEAHCEESDRRIMGAIRKERRRLLEEQRLSTALKRFNDEMSEYHRLAELREERFEKHEAVLIGRVTFDDCAYAKTTADRGRTFDLFPWHGEMQQHVGRACWFWFDREGRSRFAPVVGTRGPVVLGVQPLVLPSPDKSDEVKPA